MTSYLNVVAADDCNLSINNHKFCMKCTKNRLMVVDDLDV